MTGRPPFSRLPALAPLLEERLQSQPFVSATRTVHKPWLERLGTELRRVQLESEGETERIRGLAARLAGTAWCLAPGLQAVPYLGGTPAGTSRHVDALWVDATLYVDHGSTAKLAAAVVKELGRFFQRANVADALKLCFERTPDFVSEYLEENFKLVPPEAVAPPDEEHEEAPKAQADAEESPARPSAPPGSDSTAAARPEPGAAADDQARPELPEEESGDEFDEPETKTRRRSHPRPAAPGLIERFAARGGYAEVAPGRFVHPDGSWIAKTIGGIFPWEQRFASGTLIRYLLPREHCIEEPLELAADVWALCEGQPELYALVLVQPDGSPVELTGRRLGEMRSSGELTLYPANYRLVMKRA